METQQTVIKPIYKLAPAQVLSSDTPEDRAFILSLIKNASEQNVFYVECGPELAQDFLDLQSNTQRRITPSAVNQLVDDLTHNRFESTGDTVKFAVGGLGIDGQHRLLSIVETKSKVKLLIVVGLAPQAIEKIDLNRRRTTGDIHQTRGTGSKFTESMTQAVSLEFSDFDCRTARGMSASSKIAADDALSENEVNFLASMVRSLKVGRIQTRGALAGALRVYKMFPEDSETVTKFLDASFCNQASSPNYHKNLSGALYNYLNTTKAAQGSSQESVYNQAVAVVKTVEHYVGGEAYVSLRKASPKEKERLKR